MGESPGSEDVRAQLPAALAEELVGKLQGLRGRHDLAVDRPDFGTEPFAAARGTGTALLQQGSKGPEVSAFVHQRRLVTRPLPGDRVRQFILDASVEP